MIHHSDHDSKRCLPAKVCRRAKLIELSDLKSEDFLLVKGNFIKRENTRIQQFPLTFLSFIYSLIQLYQSELIWRICSKHHNVV